MTEYISRSEQKRRFKQTEDMAVEIAELTDNELKSFPCGDELKQEIRAIRAMKGPAHKRQIKYMARLIRSEQLEPIYDYLSERKGSLLKGRQREHEAERIRDLLINEAILDQENCRRDQRQWDADWHSEEIPAAVRTYPGLDENEVRKAVNSYVRTRNRLFYRELFRMVKAAMDLAEMKNRAL